MKVINVTEEGRWGGPQKRITEVALQLKNFGVETTVIHPALDSKKLEKELKTKNINSEKVKLQRLSKDSTALINYIVSFLADIWRLRKVFKHLKPDIIHCNGSWQIKGVLAGRLSNIPVVWHLNDTYVAKPVHNVFKVVAPLVDGFITASERTRAYYLTGSRFSNKPYKCIQAPVDAEEFSPDNTKADKNVAAFDGLKVVTVASINPVKDVETFIKMAGMVTSGMKRNVHFFITGPIPESQKKYGRKLKLKAARTNSSNIHFLGKSDNVPGILKAADLYVCSSKFEASPIAVWEAMSMKVPVISTDVGDVKNYLRRKDEPAGSVVNTGDAKGLARAVVHFLENEDLRKEAGENGRNIVKSELDLNICAKRHAAFYEEIANVKPCTGTSL